MNASAHESLRHQLLDRRRRLARAVEELGQAPDFVRLLQEVDGALKRMDARTYGQCQACHEAVDDDFLAANPLIQYCLCQLTPEQQDALQRDLDLATRIQWALLPQQDLGAAGWQAHYRYLPTGPVSGDYCDLIARDNAEGHLFFVLGDVSGKGVAASFLMARLNAMVRGLIDLGLPPAQLVERANQILTQATTESQYVTLVCGRADRSGALEVCNAGHCPPLVLRGGDVSALHSTGFPVGIFHGEPYGVSTLDLAPGETLVLYTDGLTEARNSDDEEYGADRLAALLRTHAGLAPGALAARCMQDLGAFLGGAPRTDDLTLLVLRRVGAAPDAND